MIKLPVKEYCHCDSPTVGHARMMRLLDKDIRQHHLLAVGHGIIDETTW